MNWSHPGSEGEREKRRGEKSICKCPEAEEFWLVEGSKEGSGWWENEQGEEDRLLKLVKLREL